jgi:hypothetical protein
MLRWWIVLAVIVVALSAAATFFVSVPDSSPDARTPVAEVPPGPHAKMELPSSLTYEFGTMSHHNGGTHGWEVKNVGDANLEIWLDGKPTCHCTIAEFENAGKAEEGMLAKKMIIEPGKSTKVNLKWETREWKDRDYAQSATFGTNDPARPTFTVAVKGTVVPAVIVMPPQMITLPSVSTEEPTKTKIALYSLDRPETKITRVVTSRPALIVAKSAPFKEGSTEAKYFKAKNGYTIEIEVKPGMPIGNFHDEIDIQTDHPRQPEVKVSISGSVSGPISAIPLMVRIPNVTSKLGATKDIALLVRGKTAPKFEVARRPEPLEVAIEPDDAKTKGRYRMRVTIPKGTPAGRLEGMIILKTDHPRAPELKIPVDIFVSNVGAN